MSITNIETPELQDGCGLIRQCFDAFMKTEHPEQEGFQENVAHMALSNSTAQLLEIGVAAAMAVNRQRADFQARCNEISERDLGFTAFDEMDAYDLEGLHWVDKDPAAFLREHFEEDYGRLEVEQDQRREDEEANSYSDEEE